MAAPARASLSRWWPAALLAVVVAVLTALVAVDWSPLLTLDRRVVEAAHRQAVGHDVLLATARAVTHVGDPLVVSLLSVALAAVLWLRAKHRAALAVVLARMVAIVTSTVVKHAVDRPRPHFVDAVAHASGAAFPSGHALGSAALWATAACLLRGRARTTVVVAIGATVPVLVAVSRVLLGVHWPSDTLGGLILGWLVAIGCAELFGRASGSVHQPFTRRT